MFQELFEEYRAWFIAAVVVIVGLIAFLVIRSQWGTSFDDGLFTDKTHGYSIQLPPGWGEVTDEERDQIERGFRWNWDVDFRFAAMSGDKQNFVFIVAVDNDKAQSVSVVHSVMVRSFEAQPATQVQLDETKSIGGLALHRVGVGTQTAYAEWIMFEADDVVIIISIFAIEPVQDSTFEAIDNTVASLMAT